MEIMKCSPTAQIPKYQTEGSACADLHADIHRALMMRPGESLKIPTGIAIHIKQPCLVGLVFARSGLATRKGVTLKNNTGVIDSDYQGEIMVHLVNNGRETVFINPGDRIAQIGFFPVTQVCFEEVKYFPQETERGNKGHGSTGS